ncbi:MAG: c-type cytochrome [Cyanophyceae cyanobacterium]
MQNTSSLNSTSFPSPSWIHWLQVAVVVVLISFAAFVGSQSFGQPDPYVDAVLHLNGEASRGASLFALNCAACHGEEGAGRVGPNLHGVQNRRSDRSIIEQVTSGNTPPMPQFQPDTQAMADLISYLKTL